MLFGLQNEDGSVSLYEFSKNTQQPHSRNMTTRGPLILNNSNLTEYILGGIKVIHFIYIYPHKFVLVQMNKFTD